MQVFFERREVLAPYIWHYFFRPAHPVDYVAGQYVALHLPEVSGDLRGNARTFTLTSLPADSLISFVTKFETPVSPYKQTLMDLTSAHIAKIDDAMGDLVLPKSPDVPLVFVGGGIGIASFISMVQSLTSPRDITIFYALRDTSEHIFKDAFTPYIPKIFFAPTRITAHDLIANKSDDTLYYLSGSQKFVEGLRRALLGLSISHERIIFDFFDGYNDL